MLECINRLVPIPANYDVTLLISVGIFSGNPNAITYVDSGDESDDESFAVCVHRQRLA